MKLMNHEFIIVFSKKSEKAKKINYKFLIAAKSL